jgi:VWFA-related protein
MVVLFTDGEDNMSWLSPPQVQKVAEESEALVYVVTLAGPEEVTFTVHGREVKHTEGPAARPLRQVAEATGGRLWTVSASSDLEPTFLRILAEMQSRYLLSYEPSGVASQGWHRLEVKLKGRRGTVRSRRGYFVPPRAAAAPEPPAR